MIEIQNVLISDDVKEKQFVCNLEKCKGACCVEGDLGAPVTKAELPVLEEIYEVVEPYLSEEGKAAVNEQGKYVLDFEGDYSTPTINNRECAYAVYDDRGILKCGIEQAYLDGKTEFKKPISCHLYPIRVKEYDDFTAINYDQWEICSPACDLGKELGVPVYKFLEEPLVRRFGRDWYDELKAAIED